MSKVSERYYGHVYMQQDGIPQPESLMEGGIYSIVLR